MGTETSAPHPKRVLLVEDEERLRHVIARNLEARGHEVVVAATAAEAEQAVECSHVDLMLLDIDLPDRTGWELVRDLRARGLTVPFIVVSAVTVRPGQVEEAGAIAYLPKPFPLDALLRLVSDEEAVRA